LAAFLFWADLGVKDMEMPKLKLPSVQFIVSLIIGILIISLIARMLPENIKQYFRI
jgi:predicted transporter